MPGPSGLDVLPQIKALKPALPVVMVTKSEEEGLMADALGSQLADYLLKPVQPRQVLSTLTRILGKGALQGARSGVDPTSAYGAPPAGVGVLLDMADVRLAATLLGVRSIARREQDVVFRTLNDAMLRAKLMGIQGTVRVIGKPDEAGLVDVYMRPSKGLVEPKALLKVLHRRLAAAV
jgi:CheY-like chemotaxis protein